MSSPSIVANIFGLNYIREVLIGALTVKSALIIERTATVISNAAVFYVNNLLQAVDISVTGTLVVYGAVTIAAVTIASAVITGNLSVGGATTLTGPCLCEDTLTAEVVAVSGEAAVGGRVYCNGLTNSGTTTLDGTLSVVNINNTSPTFTGLITTDAVVAASIEVTELVATQANVSTTLTTTNLTAALVESTDVIAVDMECVTLTAEVIIAA